ncbi:SWIM zinc finger family protein [Kitasatospora sp. NPDC006697]|uniref:SWIM zinc finger family protein n=1 Tax=Kitasatospora sp. NPDC006697 TaxID=3364020 RepID=UPI0036869D8D
MDERGSSGSGERARHRAARVAAGARELRLRLADEVRRGLADPAAGRGWGEVAARMVDAQAPGLAARARELPALTGEELLAGQALLDLLAAAWEQVDGLPGPLAATVRTRIGYTVTAAELLAGPTVRDRWLVLGSDERPQERLVHRRSWLLGAKTGRTALLLDYARPGHPAAPVLPLHTTLEAELAFHPAAVPLRAVLGPRYGEPEPAPPGPPPGCSLATATARYGEAVAADPWTESHPVVLAGALPLPGPHGWLLTDGQHALPLHPQTSATARWQLAAVCAGRPAAVFGECGHRGFAPVTVWDESGEPVPLDPPGGLR